MAARSIGANIRRIIFLHILSNVVAPVIVLIILTIGYVIIIEVTMSFPDLGVQPPMFSWEILLFDAQNYFSKALWLSIFPGIAITMAILDFNLLEDSLRDILNPHSDKGEGNLIYLY